MNSELATILQCKGIAVIATDTIYGIVGSAASREVVQRLYEIKGRDEVKPFIILISSIEELDQFGVSVDTFSREILAKVWPGAVTVILPVEESQREGLQYLHRGTGSLAFRMPAKESLLKLLQATGPLVAPSANPQGHPPATSIAQAKEYFGERVDRYEDEGHVEGEPSTIISINNGKVTVVREGIVSIDKIIIHCIT